MTYATNAATGWPVTRETEGAEWKLAGLKPTEQADTNKLSALGSPLSSPAFTDVVADPKFAKWTYLVSKWTLDSVLKPRTDLLVAKPEAPKPEPKPPGK